MSVQEGFVDAQGCCNDHQDPGDHPFCGGSHCPAGHCSALSFLPPSSICLPDSLTLAGEAFVRGAYPSHISIPSTPPPILLRLI
jgi:hypothetical protein